MKRMFGIFLSRVVSNFFLFIDLLRTFILIVLDYDKNEICARSFIKGWFFTENQFQFQTPLLICLVIHSFPGQLPHLPICRHLFQGSSIKLNKLYLYSFAWLYETNRLSLETTSPARDPLNCEVCWGFEIGWLVTTCCTLDDLCTFYMLTFEVRAGFTWTLEPWTGWE